MPACEAEEHHVERAVERLGLCLRVVPSVANSLASPTTLQLHFWIGVSERL